MPVPKIVTLREIAAMKEAPAGPVVIHLTQTEVENMLARARRVPAPRRATDAIVLRKLPGGGALAYPECRRRAGRACDSRIVFVRVPTLRKPLARYICNCLKATTPKLQACYVNWIKVGSFEAPGCFPGSCSTCHLGVHGSVVAPTFVCEC